ncbi:MAG: hypothetical protein GY894_11705 [Planctomycetes bacterium]|nr:hypothetical protein [Planctomycetota bacterium]MCP4840003.1 hypothetical protein [Planctomycetota bacterium]
MTRAHLDLDGSHILAEFARTCDINGSSDTNVNDLLLLLSRWGACG